MCCGSGSMYLRGRLGGFVGSGRALEGYIRDGVVHRTAAHHVKKDGFGQSLSNAICTFPWRWDSWRIGFLSPKGPCWTTGQSARRLGLHCRLRPARTNAALRDATRRFQWSARPLLGRYSMLQVLLQLPIRSYIPTVCASSEDQLHCAPA